VFFGCYLFLREDPRPSSSFFLLLSLSFHSRISSERVEPSCWLSRKVLFPPPAFFRFSPDRSFVLIKSLPRNAISIAYVLFPSRVQVQSFGLGHTRLLPASPRLRPLFRTSNRRRKEPQAKLCRTHVVQKNVITRNFS